MQGSYTQHTCKPFLRCCLSQGSQPCCGRSGMFPTPIPQHSSKPCMLDQTPGYCLKSRPHTHIPAVLLQGGISPNSHAHNRTHSTHRQLTAHRSTSSDNERRGKIEKLRPAKKTNRLCQFWHSRHMFMVPCHAASEHHHLTCPHTLLSCNLLPRGCTCMYGSPFTPGTLCPLR